MSPFDRQMMSRALQLAEQGLYTTTPNPRVGCVIVNADGHIVGEGFHQKAGQAHAEVLALQAAGDSARGSRVYVTLEPCAHTGRTGPCAQALVEAGVASVVYAMEDPNPQVAGAGVERLQAAGVKVEGPLMEDEARALNAGFIKRMTQGLPFVRCKMAMSLDGRTAMANGKSQWITGPSAREDVQRIRARSCAVITGVDTVIYDNPHFDVRLPDTERQPLRVIVDSRLRTPPQSEIFSVGGELCIAHAESTASKPFEHASLLACETKHERIDLRKLLVHLANTQQCNEVLVEAGATLSGAFLSAGLVDEIIIYMAAKLMGKEARPLFDVAINTMDGVLALNIKDVRAVGNDWRIVAEPDIES